MFLIYFPLVACYNGMIDYSLLGKHYDGINISTKTNDSFITMWYILPFYRAIQACLFLGVYFYFNEHEEYYNYVYLIYVNVGLHITYLVIFIIKWYY